MKEELAAVVRRAADPGQAGNLAREYVQARILMALQETGAMIPLAFQGGTALRFLYDLPRFSEDLDFALERALVRFPGLPHEIGASPHRSQVLSVRIEVDTRPPPGATLETTIVRRHVLLNLQHHDRASLLAGKLHAVLQRPWAKGRDLFDLFWYLSDPRWPGPNLELLNQALRQTGWEGPELDGSGWRPAVRRRVEDLDWAAAERDVAPFLEPGPATASFRRDSLLELLGRED